MPPKEILKKELCNYEELIGDAKNLSRRAHLVEFFKDDAATILGVSRYVFAGLIGGEGIAIVGTNEHNQGIEEKLKKLEIDVDLAKASGQLVFLDGEATLDSLLKNGMPSRDLFYNVIARKIDELSKTYPLVRAYGEMVNILAARGKFEEALVLEELWNELAKTRSFSLLCGYSPEHLKGDDHAAKLAKVCGCHSHVVPSAPMTGTVAV